jgi:hypothetical protein
MPGPHLVRLTDHAAWRAERRGIGRDLIEALVLEAHEQGRVNKGGAAAWRIEARGIVVLYDWPAGDDRAAALVRSVWRR